jgi:hypothetical protein
MTQDAAATPQSSAMPAPSAGTGNEIVSHAAVAVASTVPAFLAHDTPAIESRGDAHADTHADTQAPVAAPVHFDAPAVVTPPTAPTHAPEPAFDVPVAAPAYVAPAVSAASAAKAAAPVAFVPIDQIGDVTPEAPRQPRRRPRTGDINVASEPLVFIETAADKIQNVVIPVEEDTPQRRTPRPRRVRDAIAEPLVFVETKPGDQPGQPTQ